MALLLDKDSSRGHHELPQHPVFVFPAVHLPDLECQVGWHFFVGTAIGTDGLHYGVQFTRWTCSLLPAPVVFAGSQDGISLEANPFNDRAGPSSAISLQPDALVPMPVTSLTVDRGSDTPIEVAIALSSTAAEAPVLPGKDGAAPSIGGVAVELTGGEFWFDHQWGTAFMPSTNPRDEAVRAFADLPKDMTVTVEGTWVDAAGIGHEATGSLTVGRGFAESVAYVTKSEAIFAIAGVADEPMDGPVDFGHKVRAIGHLAHPSAVPAPAG
jgi:hypothetical protein